MTELEDKEAEKELIVLARETAERLRLLTARLEAYANVPSDTGDRRRVDDNEGTL